MNVTIRSEEYKDIPRISELNARAFKGSNPLEEVILIDSLRHRQDFDPELSLVAELDHQVIGHILFSLCDIRVNNIYHKCAILAPLAVHSDYQKQGIGTMLIKEGFKRLTAKGVQCSVLLGHPTYYPRFGYKTHMFNASRMKFNKNHVDCATSNLIIERRPEPKDLPILVKLWETTFKNTDMSIKPGSNLIDWISCGRGITSSVLVINQEVVGYIRYIEAEPDQIKSILTVDDQEVFKEILVHIAKKGTQDYITLPIDPNSQYAQNVTKIPFDNEEHVWPAAMLTVLNKSNRALMQYIEDVTKKRKKPGMITWPIELDVC